MTSVTQTLSPLTSASLQLCVLFLHRLLCLCGRERLQSRNSKTWRVSVETLAVGGYIFTV